MQYLLFLLFHPISTLFSAAAPFFNKHPYKSEEIGTSSTKFTLFNHFSVNFVITGETLPVG